MTRCASLAAGLAALMLLPACADGPLSLLPAGGEPAALGQRTIFPDPGGGGAGPAGRGDAGDADAGGADGRCG